MKQFMRMYNIGTIVLEHTRHFGAYEMFVSSGTTTDTFNFIGAEMK